MPEKTLNKQPSPEILMVDDNPANLEVLAGILKARGYKIRAAVSGALALDAARSQPPDLILLDINMPGLSGYEVCAQLKADEKLKEIPVIFLSVLNETMDKVKAFGVGGVDYITKPFQVEEVEARVETHLELRRQKRLVQENYDALRELEKMRDSMVHMVIHDLRSPLTVIFAFLELIKEDKKSVLSPEAARYTAECLKAAKQMIHIASDVLDTSKMQEGQMKLKLDDCDLNRVVEECIAGLESLAESRKVKFTPGPTASVRADRDIIFRVVQNLLANALKFTPDNAAIELGLEAHGDRLLLSVKDDGPGIAPEFQEKVFEKFAQVELRTGRQRYSTGLGLAFCKLAVEAHGGSIGVESAEGKGSCFWFDLPLKGPAGVGAAK